MKFGHNEPSDKSLSLFYASSRSGRESRARKRRRIAPDRAATSSEVPAKFSHNPVSPRGHRAATNTTGHTKAVDKEMAVAGTGFSMASIQLWVAKENQRVKKVRLNRRSAPSAIVKKAVSPPDINNAVICPGNRKITTAAARDTTAPAV